jgi:hypothetical protein
VNIHLDRFPNPTAPFTVLLVHGGGGYGRLFANDPVLCQLVLEDPQGGGNLVPVRFMRSLFEMRPEIEPEDFELCPVLLAHPAEDHWTTLEASRPFYQIFRAVLPL